MSDARKFFCFCEAKCKHETMTKEQILAAIHQAAQTGLVVNPDAGFISKVKETNAGATLTFWQGTQAQFNAIAEKDPYCFYIVTDSTKDAEIEKAVNDAAAHINDTNNPHSVTLEQIGAMPAGGVVWTVAIATDDGIVDALMPAFEALKNEQCGIAVVTAYKNDYCEMFCKNESIWFFTVYRENSNNGFAVGSCKDTKAAYRADFVNGTWSDWQNIGADAFAPSGYGLGGEAQTVSSWNMATKTGFYKSATDSPNGQWFEGSVISYNATHCVQSVWRAAENIHCQRQKINDTWGEWEYVNPPMAIGAEYRTTERWKGKAVYTKLVDFGELPNTGMKQILHGAAATNIIRYAATRSDGEAIPFWYAEYNVLIDVSKSGITITTSFDASTKTAAVQIWYTKD